MSAKVEVAVQTLVEEWSQRLEIAIDYLAQGDVEQLPKDSKMSIYRIVQEPLTNIARHPMPPQGKAARISVTLMRFGSETPTSEVQVIVEDDGPGFDMAQARASGRLGLLGMRERAIICGGTLQIESAPGRGTTILLRVPIDPTYAGE